MRTEERLHGGGSHFDFDIVLFDLLTGRRVILEVTRVTITQASVAGSGILASFDAALSILRERCEEANVSAVVENDEGNTQFIPIFLPPAAASVLVRTRSLRRSTSTPIRMGVGPCLWAA